jgi:hypothetical protein
MNDELVQGALADTRSAFGLAFLRPGLGPEDDRLYALGWPNRESLMTALGAPTAKQWLKEQSGTAAPAKKAAPVTKRGRRA